MDESPKQTIPKGRRKKPKMVDIGVKVRKIT